MNDTAFFLGKGGVGKTTLSSAFALSLAKRGDKVLIASLDPAHNLGDILGTRLSGEPTAIETGLDALEVDLAYWVNKYLDESRAQMKANYSYNTTFNLDSFFNIIKYSPGTEEYAVLWAIEDIHCRLGPLYDAVVFDTPPTALSLRFLSLPMISGLWVKELRQLREKILSKRQTVARINPESPIAASCIDKDEDKVYGQLKNIGLRLRGLEQLFAKESFISVIVNPDQLSVDEALRIQEELSKLGIPLSAICVNKRGMSDMAWTQHQALAGYPQFDFDFTREGIRTREDLASVGTQNLAAHFLTRAGNQ
ncbi:MAG TPA: arsenic-transporting ATPase [Spirochaetaceae bacterium]|nr:arsenic-transporting ATPase [Spirochaetaceae bacterium]